MNELRSSSKESISDKVIRGGGWVYGRMLFTNVMNLGVMVILARQLSPVDFGLVALAQVLTRFLSFLASDSVNQYVIYDNQPGREERVHAAFWMDLFLSCAATVIGLLLIPLVAGFYTEPGLGAVLGWILCRLPLDSLSKVPDALIKKNLDFKKLEIRDTILEIFIAIASVGMALSGWGVWSLVLPGFFASPIRAILIFFISPWKPRFEFNFRTWPRIFSYSASVMGGTVLSYSISEGDTLLVGKLMGSYNLGIYNLAWQSANLVGRTIVSLSNKLTFPALAAAMGDTQRLRAGMEKIFRVLAVSTFPLLIGLFVVADDFILAVYGPQWADAILPLRILIVYALRYAIGSPTGAVYKAIGRPDIGLKIMLFMLPFYLGAIWIGSFFGLAGVALGVTLIRTVFGFIDFEIVARNLGTNFIEILRPVLPALIASCIMGLLVFVIKIPFDLFLSSSHTIKLFTCVMLGGLTYLILIRSHFHSLSHDIQLVMLPLLASLNIVLHKRNR